MAPSVFVDVVPSAYGPHLTHQEVSYLEHGKPVGFSSEKAKRK